MLYARLILLGMVALLVYIAGTPAGHAGEPLPEMPADDMLLPPPPGEEMEPGEGGAPGQNQTSEYMAGEIVYSVVFVESTGGTGNCSPADPQSETWTSTERNQVLAEIGQGLAFWASRAGGPTRTFLLDNRGSWATSCEPIARPRADEGKWVADVLVGMGYSANPSNYKDKARLLADARRDALGADWAFTIFVADSSADSNGCFAAPTGCPGYAWAYLNGPFMVMTYDNDGWGIDQMNLVTAHETGHIFGAMDEYVASGCSTTDSGGYLNASNTSCNIGGVTSDVSIMGENYEWANPNVNVSASARNAIGWRNPAVEDGGRVVVDVVRTADTSLSYSGPEPTADTTPTYHGLATSPPYPPGGCNVHYGVCWRTPAPLTISLTERVEWNVDGGAFTSAGVTADDGGFGEMIEWYHFTPTSPIAYGTRTFGSREINSYGHMSSPTTDTLNISTDCDNDGILNGSDVDSDCDHFWNTYETVRGSLSGDGQSTPEICDGGSDNDKDGFADNSPQGVSWDLDNDGFKDCADGDMDTDGDGVINLLDSDDDGDGFTEYYGTPYSTQETYMSTDSLSACRANSSHDAYPPDGNRDGAVNVGDVTALFAGKIINPPGYDVRSDADTNGVINVGDLTIFFGGGKILTLCTSLTFSNATGGAVDGIHIEWGGTLVASFIARDSEFKGWSNRTISGGTVLDMDRPDALGNLANGGQLNVVVLGGGTMSSCRWTLEGVDRGPC